MLASDRCARNDHLVAAYSAVVPSSFKEPGDATDTRLVGFSRAILMTTAGVAARSSSHDAPPATKAAAPTFSKDVAPVLFKRCAECHRPGAMAPMSLLTFEDARPWAKAIKHKVAKREMPPWGADPSIGAFANDPSLKQSEIDMIVAWADAGAPEGDRNDLPPAPTFTEGWSIGKPDHIFTMLQPFQVPADGTVPYMYVTIPTNLKEDIWIRGVELKPSDRRVVHHIISDLSKATASRWIRRRN